MPRHRSQLSDGVAADAAGLAFIEAPTTPCQISAAHSPLNPRGPEKFNTILGISQAHFLTGNYKEAAHWAAQGLRERPHETWALRISAVAQVRCGQMAAGRQSAALLQATPQYPGITVGTIINALPMMPAELLARQAEALESAGLPV